MAGLAAARQLHKSLGYSEVIILEARNRVGGRVNTDISFGGAVDLGASIITGLEGNPITNICKQLKTQLHPLGYECPIYDINGKKINEEIDVKMEQEFNNLLEKASKNANNLPPSLGDAMEYLFSNSEFINQEKNKDILLLCDRLLNWHIANLEYACASELKYVSLKNWDQDDKYEWAGDHCLIREGYGSIAQSLAKDMNIKFNSVVKKIEYNQKGVRVFTEDNEIFEADVILVTIPLGVLKKE